MQKFHKFLYSILTFLQKVINYFLIRVRRKIKTHTNEEFERSVEKWFAIKGDETLRLDYPELSTNDLVLDLGGYKGQWASDIFSKYQPTVYIFEPYIPFYENIQQRFIKNDKIKVFPFGLGNQSSILSISYSDDGTSFFRAGSTEQKAEIKNIKDFFEENNISEVALMKINIEGGEYDLLEYMIANDLHVKIKNIQIQFHNKYVDKPEIRMKNIQNALAHTHKLTWQYVFVWENWKRKS